MESSKNTFISLIASLSKTTKAETASIKSDNILFSKLLSEETQKLEQRDVSAKKAESLVPERGKSDKAAQGKTGKSQAKSKDLPAGKFLPPEVELSPLLYYLYHLVIKSPDAISLRDKQAYGLDTESYQKVDLKELQKLLNQKGLDINKFTPEQITQLINRGSRSNLMAYLDQLVKDQRLATDLAAEKALRASKTSESAGKVFEKVKTPESLNRQEIIQQIIQHIRVRNLAETSEIVIRLNPEYLGQVKLRIITEGNKVRVSVETTSRVARDIIRDSRRELQDAFDDQGLALSALDATVVEEI